MAVYDLEEQEQIAEIKAWWNQYGNMIVVAVLVVALGFAGWRFWGRMQDNKAAEAGALYSELLQVARVGDAQRSRDIPSRLIEQYGGTSQAQLGALLSAGVQFRRQDFDNARTALEWAADKGKDATLRQLARLRLASVLLQQGALDDALARLQPVPEGAFRERFEDLRGDVLAAQGKAAEARAAWSAALDALGETGENDAPMRGLIRAKLESLEG